MWRPWFVVVVVASGCSFSTDVAPAVEPPAIDAPEQMPACAGPDGDGDGVNDPCDPCPQDNPDDSDGDGVCNAVDACAAGDDAADADGDAVADACDDWPCGALPAAPPSTVTWMTPNENVTLSQVTVAGMGQRVVVAPGAQIAIASAYSIVDCQCPGCIDQIEIGFHTVGKAACLYDGNPAGNGVGTCANPTTGQATRMATAPTTPGLYELRFNRGNDTTCRSNGAWWANVPPGAGTTFALVCVR